MGEGSLRGLRGEMGTVTKSMTTKRMAMIGMRIVPVTKMAANNRPAGDCIQYFDFSSG